MTEPLKLLAVLAHPDDETFGIGGALARYAAEGIETQHQYDILRATTCRLGQGYHFGRPTPVDAFVERFAPRG